jgi:signal transduction histidine kinase/HAMP domain-containing protein
VLLNVSLKGLRFKIIAWSFIPTAIILLAAAMVTFYAYQRVTEDLVLGRNQELIRLSAGQLSADMTGYSDLLSGLARNADIYGNDPMMQQLALTRSRDRLVVFDAGVLIMNSAGKVVAAEPARPDIFARNLSDRSYFAQLLRTEAPVFSDATTDGPEGREVIVVAVPILGERGEFRGTMSGMFHLGATSVSAFYGGIVKLRLGENGRIHLVDGNRKIIYDSDASRMGQRFADGGVGQRLAERKVGDLRTRNDEGQEIAASFAPVPGTPWSLVVEERWDALMASSQSYQQFLLLLLVLGVVVPAVVVMVAVGRITGPIALLTRGAQEVAAGSFGRKISVSTGDEVEELAKQFNLMSTQLQEYTSNLEKRVADRTRELAALNDVAEVVSCSLNLDEILHGALEKVLETMALDAGGIFLLDDRLGVLSIAAHRGLDPDLISSIDNLKPGEGFSGRVLQFGEPMVVTDIANDPRLATGVPKEHVQHSMASVPLTSRSKVVGTMFAGSYIDRHFSQQDLQLLCSIGRQIGVAVENARLFASEQRRAEQFRVISEVGHRITSILAVEELLHEIVSLVMENLGYHMVGIGLIEGDEVVFRAGAGPGWSARGRSQLRLKVGVEGITGWVAARGEPLLVRDVTSDPRFLKIVEADEARSELAVPLKTHEAVIGVLDVQSDRLNAFDDSDLGVLQTLAHQAAVAIENARLYERAQRLAVMEERNRLARDLHDSVTQAVYGVTLYAEAATRLLATGQVDVATSHLQELRTTAQQALREMRSLIFELRPPVLEQEGLVAALQARLESVEARAGIGTELKIDGESPLPKEIEEGLYRIAQEALNNVLKHSEARNVRLYLRREDGAAMLEVSDDGIGFDPVADGEHGGLGLGGMEERASLMGANLTIRSNPGGGTTVRVEVTSMSGGCGIDG